MELRQLLVHFSGQPSDGARVEAALKLAVTHGARLDGIFVYHQIAKPQSGSLFIPEEVFAVYEREVDDLADRLGAEFGERLARAGVDGRWTFSRGPTDAEIDRLARFSDLVVVGQHDERYGADENALVNYHVAQNVAGPLLIIPYVGIADAIGQRVLVAWDGSVAAARAVNDALPILERAAQVVVLTVDNPPQVEGDLPDVELCARLARRGVSVEADNEQSGTIGVGDCLLSYACDRDIDLIVMGASSRSRAYDAVVGGVTGSLLGQMTVPLLVSR